MIEPIRRTAEAQARRIGANLSASIQEIRSFADREAELSGLPGQDQGPADAYRHLVGVAEMARRFRPIPAGVMAEYNELRSWQAMRWERRAGRLISESNTPEARAMDRHNNRIAIQIGATASSPEEVVRRARVAMERAIQSHGGSGENNTPSWRGWRYWSDGEPLTNWSPNNWPEIDGTDQLRAYRAALAARGEGQGRSTGGGPVRVSPHIRDGNPVSGHTRSAPSR